MAKSETSTKADGRNCALQNSIALRKAVEDLISELASACVKISTVGQLRRRSPVINEIRLLVVPRCECVKSGDPFVKSALIVNVINKCNSFNFHHCCALCQIAKRLLADFDIPVQIIKTNETAWASMLFRHTAALNLQISVHTVAKARGYVWVPEAGMFRSKTGAAPVLIHSEDDVFTFTRIPYLPVEMRGGDPVFEMEVSGRTLPMRMDEARRLISESHWVDTKCGGEWHQYTLRPLAPDERNFVHLVETIRTHGYDGYYLGKAYRYLDLDGWMYFTQGYEMRVTFLINRKKLRSMDKSWRYNPKAFRALNVSLPMLKKVEK
jgi:hypothetical protein